MKLYKMIEIYLKYDNIHTIRTVNAFLYINNHVNSCINIMLSVSSSIFVFFIFLSFYFLILHQKEVFSLLFHFL